MDADGRPRAPTPRPRPPEFTGAPPEAAVRPMTVVLAPAGPPPKREKRSAPALLQRIVMPESISKQ